MTYTIRHAEVLVGYFDIEADDESDAIERFDDKAWSGELDFSDMEMIESYNTVVPATKTIDPW